MQDNEKIYKIELTNKEYEFLESLKKELILSNISKLVAPGKLAI